MDTFVTMTQFDSMKEIEDKKNLFNSLTYRERKISDTRQIELTGMNVSDFYEFMKDTYIDSNPVKTSIDDVLNESLTDDLRNKYNKTKLNNAIIDRLIDKYQGELNKVRNLDKTDFKAIFSVIKFKGDKKLSKENYIYLLEDNISYLKTLKQINQKENTTVDSIMIKQFDSLCRMRMDKEDKLEVADAIIKNCEEIIMAYDISISYMYGEDSNIETGLKKLSNITINKIGYMIIGPISNILDYTIKRSTNSMMVKLRSSTNPKEDMIKYRDKMENTLIVLKEKRKVIERDYNIEKE